MAKNLGGIGFSFAAIDRGLEKTVMGLSKGFEMMWTKASRMASGARAIGAKIGGAIAGIGRRGRGAFSAVSGMLDNMASKALSPDIDNAFSSMFATFNKGWGEITVGMKMSAKESKRWRRAIGSAAFGLNADMTATAKSWASFTQQNIKLQDVLGTKGTTGTIKRLIKMTSVLGVEGEKLAAMTADLTKSWGFSEKGVRSLMDQVFALGKHFNMGKEAMQGMPAIVETLNTELASMMKNASPSDIRRLTLSIVKLSGGFKAMGVPAGEAIELSRKVFTTIIGQRKNIEGMLVGMGGDIDELSKEMGIASGDIHKVFGMIGKDPAQFMEQLFQLANEAKKRGGETGVAFQRLLKIVDKSMGKDVAFAIRGNWTKAQKAMIGSTEALAKSHGALGKAVDKAYKSGRTKGEAYNLMIQSFQARIKRMTDKDLNKWIKMQKTGFNDTMKVLKKLNADRGPIGTLTKKLLLVQRVGISGLFTSLGGLGPLISGTVTKMAPMLTALGAMGLNLGLIAKLLLPGGIILAGFALFHKGFRDKVIAVIERFVGDVRKHFPKALEIVKDTLGKIWTGVQIGLNDLIAWMKTYDWAGAFSTLFKWVGIILEKLGKFILKYAPKFIAVFAKLISSLADAIGKVDWGAVANKLITFILKAAKFVVNTLIDTLKGLFTGLWNSIFGGTSLAIKTGTKTVGAKLGKALAKLVKALVKAALQIIWTLIKRLPEILWTLAKLMWKWFKWPFEMVGKIAVKVWGKIKALLKGFVDWAAGWANTVWGYLRKPWDWLIGKLNWFRDKFAWVWNKITGDVESGAQFMGEVTGGAISGMMKDFKTLQKGSALTFGDLKRIGMSAWEGISDAAGYSANLQLQYQMLVSKHLKKGTFFMKAYMDAIVDLAKMRVMQAARARGIDISKSQQQWMRKQAMASGVSATAAAAATKAPSLRSIKAAPKVSALPTVTAKTPSARRMETKEAMRKAKKGDSQLVALLKELGNQIVNLSKAIKDMNSRPVHVYLRGDAGKFVKAVGRQVRGGTASRAAGAGVYGD